MSVCVVVSSVFCLMVLYRMSCVHTQTMLGIRSALCVQGLRRTAVGHQRHCRNWSLRARRTSRTEDGRGAWSLDRDNHDAFSRKFHADRRWDGPVSRIDSDRRVGHAVSYVESDRRRVRPIMPKVVSDRWVRTVPRVEPDGRRRVGPMFRGVSDRRFVRPVPWIGSDRHVGPMSRAESDRHDRPRRSSACIVLRRRKCSAMRKSSDVWKNQQRTDAGGVNRERWWALVLRRR